MLGQRRCSSMERERWGERWQHVILDCGGCVLAAETSSGTLQGYFIAIDDAQDRFCMIDVARFNTVLSCRKSPLIQWTAAQDLEKVACCRAVFQMDPCLRCGRERHELVGCSPCPRSGSAKRAVRSSSKTAAPHYTL